MSGDRQYLTGHAKGRFLCRVEGNPVEVTINGVRTSHPTGALVEIPPGSEFRVEGPRGWRLTEVAAVSTHNTTEPPATFWSEVAWRRRIGEWPHKRVKP